MENVLGPWEITFGFLSFIATISVGVLFPWMRSIQQGHKDSMITLKEGMDELNKELTDFRITVAKEYASAAMVASIREEVLQRMDKLADKLDGIRDAYARDHPSVRRNIENR